MAESKRGNATGVEFILRHCNGTDINTEDSSHYRYTPLIWACKNGHREVVELLLEKQDINITKMSSWGMTPLTYASQKGFPEIVELLLGEERININHVDNINNTALIWHLLKDNPR